MKNELITMVLFILFVAALNFGYHHPIVGDLTNNNWDMHITIYLSDATITAHVREYVKNGTTYHIESIWSGTETDVYTITFTKTLSTTTTTATNISLTTSVTTTTTTTTITTSHTTTTTSTTITTTITSSSTTHYTVTVQTPTPNSIVYMTTRIIAYNQYSVIVWASVVYTDSTVVGYTTYYYTTTRV